MIRRCLVVLLFVLVAAVSLSLARAQEMTTDAERSWRELRGSEDVKRKLLAERWYSVDPAAGLEQRHVASSRRRPSTSPTIRSSRG